MQDEKIVIKKNPNGDTRTAPKNITIEQFAEANDSHISDVSRIMKKMSELVEASGRNHDWTKKFYENEFYKDFCGTMNNGENFVEGQWYQKHITLERHHPNSFCHKDINLIDILEMVVDCTVAGLARSGKTFPISIDKDILSKAVDNTMELIKNMVEVEEQRNNNGQSEN